MKLLFNLKIFSQVLFINSIEMLSTYLHIFEDFHVLIQLYLGSKPMSDILNTPILIPFALKVLFLVYWLKYWFWRRSLLDISCFEKVDISGSINVLVGIVLRKLCHY